MFKVNKCLHHLRLEVSGLEITHVAYDVADSESMPYHVAAIDVVLVRLPVLRHHSSVLTWIREQFNHDALGGVSPRKDSHAGIVGWSLLEVGTLMLIPGVIRYLLVVLSTRLPLVVETFLPNPGVI